MSLDKVVQTLIATVKCYYPYLRDDNNNIAYNFGARTKPGLDKSWTGQILDKQILDRTKLRQGIS